MVDTPPPDDAAPPPSGPQPGVPPAWAGPPASEPPTQWSQDPSTPAADAPPPGYRPLPGPNNPGYGAPGPAAPGYGAPGYGAPGYGAPGYGYGYGGPGQFAAPSGPYGAPGPALPPGAWPQSPPTEGMAIASLVLGIVALAGTLCCYFGWLGAIGLPLGIVARKRIAASNGTKSGAGMALAGIICSAIALALFLLFAALIVIAVIADGTSSNPSPFA